MSVVVPPSLVTNLFKEIPLKQHKGPMRGYYPYKIERKKGSYFPILGSIVVINQAIEFLETYGLLRN